jgi:hypothetical protein
MNIIITKIYIISHQNIISKHPDIFEVRKFSDATKIRYNSGHF